MINPELRKYIPSLSGKDDIFTKMSLLFVEAYEEIERLEALLKIGNIKHDRHEGIDNLPMRYLEIMKEYQEQLFAQPAEEVQE